MLTCHGHFGRLGYACQDQQFAYLSQCEAKAGPHCLLLGCACLLAVDQGLLAAASANRTGSTANSPFGYDPVFGTYSSLWNIQLVGQEGSFYNLTAVRELSVLPFRQLACTASLCGHASPPPSAGFQRGRRLWQSLWLHG